LGSALCVSIWLSAAAAAQSAPPAAAQADPRWVAAEGGVVNDMKTGLQWTREDNGSDVDWNSARSYCAAKQHGWRLPSLEELGSLYIEPGAGGPGQRAEGSACGHAVCRTSALFALGDSWFWSSTPVGQDGSDGIELAWGLQLINGARTPSVMEADFGRALCVRRR
jgi:Protein of unknown function (DUF1566)